MSNTDHTCCCPANAKVIVVPVPSAHCCSPDSSASACCQSASETDQSSGDACGCSTIVMVCTPACC
ncbi:MAG: hypothetical protein ACF8GE_00145 [Phycisphaerales bacterium JB043]